MHPPAAGDFLWSARDAKVSRARYVVHHVNLADHLAPHLTCVPHTCTCARIARRLYKEQNHACARCELRIFDGSEVILVRGALRDGLVTAGEQRERRGVRGLKGAIVVALRGQGLSWKVFEGSKKNAHPPMI